RPLLRRLERGGPHRHGRFVLRRGRPRPCRDAAGGGRGRARRGDRVRARLLSGLRALLPLPPPLRRPGPERFHAPRRLPPALRGRPPRRARPRPAGARQLLQPLPRPPRPEHARLRHRLPRRRPPPRVHPLALRLPPPGRRRGGRAPVPRTAPVRAAGGRPLPVLARLHRRTVTTAASPPARTP